MNVNGSQSILLSLYSCDSNRLAECPAMNLWGILWVLFWMGSVLDEFRLIAFIVGIKVTKNQMQGYIPSTWRL